MQPDPEQWPEEWRYLFYERWGICQFDGNMPEDEARAAAYEDVSRQMERALGKQARMF